MSIEDFQKNFGTEEQCRQYLFEKRWGDGFECLKCHGKEYSDIKSRSLYRCKNCGYQSSVTAGTEFDKTRTPLTAWFMAIYLFAEEYEKIVVEKLQIKLGVAYSTAWSIRSKIQESKRDESGIIYELLLEFASNKKTDIQEDNAITDTQILLTSQPDSKTEDDIIFVYDKNKRLTIGEMARLTGTSIKSFRYYEQINILKPVYIQPETKYRYYSVEQVQLVEIINFCIELGIPLKELAGLEEMYKDTGFQNFLDRGKDIAQKKLAAIKSGLKLIDRIEDKMKIEKKYQFGQIYTRHFSEKIIYVRPLEKTKRVTVTDMIKAYFDVSVSQSSKISFSEYGMLYESNSNGVKYSYFFDATSDAEGEDRIALPAGSYLCCRHESHQIHHTAKIFKDYLIGKTSFLAIEVEELSTKKQAESQYTYELRVIAL